MLGSRGQEATPPQRPGVKVTDMEGNSGPRRREERVRAKSVGTGDIAKWRGGFRKGSEEGK
jgi:hypothetical protein